MERITLAGTYAGRYRLSLELSMTDTHEWAGVARLSTQVRGREVESYRIAGRLVTGKITLIKCVNAENSKGAPTQKRTAFEAILNRLYKEQVREVAA